MKKIHKEKGFTLIELLVVIAIIAILSTVVMAGLNSARAKGRDAKRLADIKQVQAALELFFDSCGGYSAATSWAALATSNAGGAPCPTTPTAITFATYMTKMPVNPTPGGIAYTYAPSSPVGANYSINFSLEGSAGSLLAGTHTAAASGIL